jgi:hypothetical protein
MAIFHEGLLKERSILSQGNVELVYIVRGEGRGIMRLIKLALKSWLWMAVVQWAVVAYGQDLGHKLPGLIGLDAGTIPPPGLSVVDRFVVFNADELRDRNGNVIPIPGLEMQGISNAVGISYTYKLPRGCTSLTSRAAAPIARLTLSIPERPEASFDRFGLTDIYVLPLQWGCQTDRFDVVASYSLYIPTGQFLLGGGKGLSSGNITHEFSFGGSIYRSKERTSFITALASYNLNLRKRNIDITRGDTFNIQGGAGVSRYNHVLEAGLAGYALWQVRDDRGADLPPVLRDGRDRVFGLGPEVAVLIKSINSQFRARYEWEFGVRSRPQASIFVFGVNILVHPSEPPPAP